MKKLGEILHTASSGYIIATSILRDPKRLLNTIVYDRDLRRIGRIVDIIGPVNSPYVVIKPESKDILDSIEQGPVYYYMAKKRKSKGRKSKHFKHTKKRFKR